MFRTVAKEFQKKTKISFIKYMFDFVYVHIYHLDVYELYKYFSYQSKTGTEPKLFVGQKGVFSRKLLFEKIFILQVWPSFEGNTAGFCGTATMLVVSVVTGEMF
jgi:hypothetical protein